MDRVILDHQRPIASRKPRGYVTQTQRGAEAAADAEMQARIERAHEEQRAAVLRSLGRSR